MATYGDGFRDGSAHRVVLDNDLNRRLHLRVHELETELASLRAEVERLSAPVDDEMAGAGLNKLLEVQGNGGPLTRMKLAISAALAERGRT